ncbi:MAG: MarR family transcriptional regulator [Alphaproteobacteria bacterium]|nr:MarR family transcriptional regulator [Alphaproteobacteria bacterium]
MSIQSSFKEDTRDSAWVAFVTAHAVVMECIERRFAGAGFPPLAWYDALWALERAPHHRRRMFELADWLVIGRSNATRLIDQLEKAGLVLRSKSADDRRGAIAEITAEGLLLRKKMWKVYEVAIDELFDQQLSLREQGLLGAAMRRMASCAWAEKQRIAPAMACPPALEPYVGKRPKKRLVVDEDFEPKPANNP